MSETEKLVVDYLKNKAVKEPDAATKKGLRMAEGALTSYYWKGAEGCVRKMIESGAASLDQRERNLLDFGLVDARLSGKKSIVAGIADELTAEHAYEGLPRCYYLSQWLDERWSSYHTVQDIVSSSLGSEDVAQSESGENGEIQRLTRLRDDVYLKVQPYLVGIPGLNETIIKSVVSGALDTQLENLSLSCYHHPTADALAQRNKMAVVRRNIVRSLSQRLQNHKFLPLVAALDGIANNLWQEKLKVSMREGLVKKDVSSELSEEEQKQKQCDFLLGEMHIVKSLMPIAGVEGRKYKTSPVMLDFGERVTKRDVARVWAKIEAVDPRLPGLPDVLLAPCDGSAFFEWDRDTLFIPIHATTNIEDCIINGVANYRILMDMQGERIIKNFYTEANPKADFKTAFVRDYKDWVTHISKGNMGALKERVLQFFFDNFGPDVERVPAPRHLAAASSMEQQTKIDELILRLKAKTITAEQCFDLGILFWIHRKFDNAIKLMEMALTMGAEADKVLVCLAYLNREKGFFKVASGHLRKVRESHRGSIWYLIAQRAK